MKNKNIKVIDEHNIDRNANIMFAIELNGSEYVVYWIERDEESNNVFVSKVLKNLDGTHNMLNIDDTDKKKEVSEIVKSLVSSAVTDQNDKLIGLTKTLSTGETVKFVNVSFNKEQNINVPKTYITTVKKEVTKVVEGYYDVVTEEQKIDNVLTATPVMPSDTPEIVEPITNVTSTTPEVTIPTPVAIPEPVLVQPTPVVQSMPEATIVASPATAPVVPEAPVVAVAPAVAVETPVVPQPTPVVVPEPVLVQPAPVVAESIVNNASVEQQPLVFNAAKETNLNAALGEVANSTAMPVENINAVREFGEDTPMAQPIAQPVVAPMNQSQSAVNPKIAENKGGFANSKFFMVIAIAFFMASCVFLGYEVFNYFQLTK